MRNENEFLSDVSCAIDDKEVLQLSRELIKIPSIMKNEHRISSYIFQKLEKWGLSPRLVPVGGYGPSVVSEIGRKNASAIALNGHVDTVEVMRGWKHNPFGAKVENGMLYGLGALDMKCGLAALMIAFRTLGELGAIKSGRVVLQAVSGEEDTSAGTRALMAKGEFRNVKNVIVGEGFGGLSSISIGRRGGSYFDIYVKGKAAHGSKPSDGISAISDAARIVSALDGMKMKIRSDLEGDDFLPLRESQTILRISGGSETLSVPERCQIRVIRCTLPGGEGNVERDIRRVVRELGLRSKVRIVPEKGAANYFEPYVMSPKSALVIASSKWIKRLTGKNPARVVGLSEADDNRIAHDLGIPVICFGPGETGELARYHQAEEGISIEQLGTVARAYCMVAADLAGKS